MGDGSCCFFFQAEDGIRDYKVTGVQTCALPIYVGTDIAAIDGREAEARRERKRKLREIRRQLKDDPERLARFDHELNHAVKRAWVRSGEHTSELQSPCNLVCRLLLEKKKNNSDA